MERNSFDVAAVGAAFKRTMLIPVISVSLSEERDLTNPNPDYHQNGQESLRYCLDMAVRLGVDRITGPFAPHLLACG